MSRLVPVLCSCIQHFRFVEHMHEVCSAQVFISHRAEYKVDNRSSTLDIGMIYHTRRLEPGKHKLFYKFFQGNAVLESNGNRDGETIQHTTHRGTFLGHINEDFTE